MGYKELDKPEYRHKEKWMHQHPLERIVQLRGGFELVKKVEEFGTEKFKEKYRVLDVDNKEEVKRWEYTYLNQDNESTKKEMRRFLQSYDLLPGSQWGLFISISMLKDLIKDYIPESVLEYENFWRNINPSRNMGLAYFSSDDKNEIYCVTNDMDRLERQNFTNFVNKILDFDSEDKMNLLFNAGKEGDEWRKNTKKYCRDLLVLIRKNHLEIIENYAESEIKKLIEHHISETENEETVRNIYLDSVPFMKDLCDFYLEKMV